MKKIFTSVLVLIMLLSLVGCGEIASTSSDSPTGQDKTDTIDPGSTTGFAKYGLTGIIPADADNVVCNRDEYSTMEYTFTMPVVDKEAEQLAYQNYCLEAIRAGSDNGKAYRYTATWDTAANKMVTWYEEFVNYEQLPEGGFGLIVTYYYQDTLLQMVISDKGNDTVHSYDLFLSPSTNDTLPEK